MNQLFKFFNKKAKETDQQEEGLKIYLDFELKTFKFLPVDDFSNSEHISLMIIEELLKGGQSIFIYGQEIVKIADFPFKRYSSLYLIIKIHQTNSLISQRKLNFYECPLSMIRDKDKNQDFSFVFSSNETVSAALPITNQENLVGRRSSKKNNAILKSKPTSKKKKKSGESINFEEEKVVRSGNLKKKNKKGDYVEKIFVLYKNKLVYYEPKDKGFFLIIFC